MISAPNSSVTINSASYDPITNKVIVDFSYTSSIDSSQVQLMLNTTVVSQLIAVQPFKISFNA
jgi:anti-anti-sigma regulatory factor